MKLLTNLFAALLFAFPLLAADAPTKVAKYDGKVMPIVEASKKLNTKIDGDASTLVLVTKDGSYFTLQRDEASDLLYLDKQLHHRDLRLAASPVAGTKKLKVELVQSIKDGKLFDIDYWCDNCQLAASKPGKCFCCGADTALRELPAK
jgi:hypothetical protein